MLFLRVRFPPSSRAAALIPAKRGLRARRALIPHATGLVQSSAPLTNISFTAAPVGSGRVSVPVWGAFSSENPYASSPTVAAVHPAHQLYAPHAHLRGSLLWPPRDAPGWRRGVIRPVFPPVIPLRGQVATCYSPVRCLPAGRHWRTMPRLPLDFACVKAVSLAFHHWSQDKLFVVLSRFFILSESFAARLAAARNLTLPTETVLPARLSPS